MIDSALFYNLMAAIGPTTSVVLVGDPNQLPPVGAGSTLRDILEHKLAPTVRLEKVHRQAGHLKFNSVRVLAGSVEPTVVDHPEGEVSPWMVHKKIGNADQLKKAVESLYKQHLPKWKFHPISDVQFMTAKHSHGFGTKRINALLQWMHQESRGVSIAEPDIESDERPTIRVGDKVIQTKNNYDLNVMNGEIGIVTHVALTRNELRDAVGLAPLTEDPFAASLHEPDPGIGGYATAVNAKGPDAAVVAEFVVKLADRTVVFPNGTAGDLELAYCLSVHKMQGSQVPCAIVICPKSHGFMQTRSWLYTAVTRAQKTCIIMGDEDGIRRAAEKQELDKRETVTRVLATQETRDAEREAEPTPDEFDRGDGGSFDDEDGDNEFYQSHDGND